MSNVYIGTSGWQYKHWSGNFYPSGLPQKDWLKFYSKHFDTVEVNANFYRQTKASTFEKWISETPENFVFSIKGNRFITHIKRLKDCEEPLRIFFEAAGALVKSNKSQVTSKNVVLWQLPPSLKIDVERLKDFIKLLPKNFRHAFEFRHKTWVDKKAIDILVNAKVSTTLVFQDWKDWPATADYAELLGLRGLEKLQFIYIRFHGKDRLYTSGYSEEELANWAKKVQEWIKAGLDIYVYFNNDALGYAVENAITLKQLTCDN